MIDIRNLSKTYVSESVKVCALKDVCIQIEQGAYLAIMGASGSGKSTLLHIIGAMDRASSGVYFFNEEPVHSMNSEEMNHFRAENIGFVFQDFALLDYYTVKENIMMPLICKRVARKECEERVLKVMEKLAITEIADKRTTHISGGQKARVAIARAIVTDAKVILADEPTGALDRKTGEEVMKLFDQLNLDGSTIIIVTHDMNVARHAKKVFGVEDGNLFPMEV